mmetsp:Transcript_31689/g.72707  ORF Transcript_31689/g.72707 Transcript_31689/m.72707 type:complete len:217 (-) Transcript_31689:1448-2098(-)
MFHGPGPEIHPGLSHDVRFGPVGFFLHMPQPSVEERFHLGPRVGIGVEGRVSETPEPFDGAAVGEFVGKGHAGDGDGGDNPGAAQLFDGGAVVHDAGLLGAVGFDAADVAGLGFGDGGHEGGELGAELGPHRGAGFGLAPAFGRGGQFGAGGEDEFFADERVGTAARALEEIGGDHVGILGYEKSGVILDRPGIMMNGELIGPIHLVGDEYVGVFV